MKCLKRSRHSTNSAKPTSILKKKTTGSAQRMSNSPATRTQTRKSNCIWKSRKRTINWERIIWSYRKTCKRRSTWSKRCRKLKWEKPWRQMPQVRVRLIQEWKRISIHWSIACHLNPRYRDLLKFPILALRSVGLRLYPKWWSWLLLLMKFSSKTRSIAANSRNRSINSASIFKRIHHQSTTSRNRCHPRILRVNSKRHRYRIGPANKRTSPLCQEATASRTPKEIWHPPKNTGLLIIRRRRCTPAAIWNKINIRLMTGPLRLGKIWIRSHNHNRSSCLEALAVAPQDSCFSNSSVTLFRAMVTRSLEAQ